MKFYKRDPDRALAGMSALNSAQRGIYNSIIDLLYSRDNVVACASDDDDRQIAKSITVDIREWRRIKRELMELGKIRVTKHGLLDANGVEICLRSAEHRSDVARKSVTHRWEMYRLAKQLNGPAILQRNTSKRERESSTSTSLEAEQTEAGEDSGENDESFGVVATGHSVATGALEAVVRAKGWTK